MTSLITTFWNIYTESLKQTDQAIPVKYEAWHFCNNESDANELAKLVYEGQKTATAGLVWSYEAEGCPIPKPGDLSVITFWDGSPVCIIETVDCAVLPFKEVPASFAFEEGEGDRSLEYWRNAHIKFFTEECTAMGKLPESTMPVVCERFKVVYRKEGLFSG